MNLLTLILLLVEKSRQQKKISDRRLNSVHTSYTGVNWIRYWIGRGFVKDHRTPFFKKRSYY